MRQKFEEIIENSHPLVRRIINSTQVLIQDMVRCDLFKFASAMAYVTLLSIIPSIAAVFALLTIFSPFLGEGTDLISAAKSYILSHLAAGTGEQAVSVLDGLLANLSIKQIGVSGFAGMIFSLILLLRQIELAFNRIWQIEKPRGMIKRFIYFWTFLTLGAFTIFLLIGVLSGFDLNSLNPFGSEGVHELSILAKLSPVIATIVIFTCSYFIIPNTHVGIRHALFGAVPASLLFVFASSFYGYYTKTFTSYQAIYGALAAIPLFLFWIYIQWTILLLGVIISWRSQQGFFDINEKEKELEIEAITRPEKDRDTHIKSLLPIFIIVRCHQEFEKASATGISIKELSNSLEVPQPWIADALESLKFHNLITTAEVDATNPIYRVYPTAPANKILVKNVLKALSSETREWITDRSKNNGIDIKKLLKEIFESYFNDDNKTFFDLISD